MTDDHGDPRTADRRRPSRGALVATAVAALAAVATGFAILPLAETPEEALATRTPTTDDIPAGSLDEAGSTCTPGIDDNSLWTRKAVITEERGGIAFVVARTPAKLWHCLLVDGELRSSGNASLEARTEVARDDVQTVTLTGSGDGADAYTAVTGVVGEGVTAVEVHPRGPISEPGALAAGELPTSVTATVDDGHFGAWWPGHDDDVRLTIHLADGTERANVPAFEHDR